MKRDESGNIREAKQPLDIGIIKFHLPYMIFFPTALIWNEREYFFPFFQVIFFTLYSLHISFPSAILDILSQQTYHPPGGKKRELYTLLNLCRFPNLIENINEKTLKKN